MSKCGQDCCDRCVAFGMDINNTKHLLQKAYDDGSEWGSNHADIAHRQGTIWGIDWMLMLLKNTMRQHRWTKPQRDSVKFTIKLIEEIQEDMVVSANKYMLENYGPGNEVWTSKTRHMLAKMRIEE